MLMEHTTIKEVANKAQVSTATVSRVLSGKYRHTSETVENVKRIIEELRVARSLPAPEIAVPESIGIAMFAYRDFLNDSYNSTLITSIMETLTTENLTAQLIALTPTRLNIEYIKNLIRAYHLRGLIIPEFDVLYAISRQLEQLPIPVVGIGQLALRHHVCSDAFRAGSEAANYLWCNGHRRFGIVSMSRTDLGHEQRVTGFMETVRQLGGGTARIWRQELRTMEDTVSGWVSEMLNRKEAPTAVLVTNSFICQKIYAELVQAGLSVPEDVSLLSFEENGELEHLPVPISVLAQPTRAMGAMAVDMLVKHLRNIEVKDREVMNCSLIIRKSVRNIPVK